MNDSNFCDMESRILNARRDGHWDDALLNHLENCAYCRDTDGMATWMQHAAVIHVEKPRPDPDVIWMMACLTKRKLQWTSRMVTGIAALMASAVLAAFAWRAIASYLSSVLPAGAMSLVPFFVSSILTLSLTAVAVTTNRLLSDD